MSAEKPKKPEKTEVEVVWGSNSQVLSHKDQLKELDQITGSEHLFCADSVTLGRYCHLYYSEQSIDKSFTEYMRKKLSESYGFKVNEDLFNLNIITALKVIQEKRTHTPILKSNQLFLGITSFKDLEYGELAGGLMSHVLLKSQVDYQSGWMFQKEGSQEFSDKENFKALKKQFDLTFQKVYGNNPISYEITTEEGDLLKFRNSNEIYCWLMARSQNYNPDSMEKYSW